MDKLDTNTLIHLGQYFPFSNTWYNHNVLSSIGRVSRGWRIIALKIWAMQFVQQCMANPTSTFVQWECPHENIIKYIRWALNVRPERMFILNPILNPCTGCYVKCRKSQCYCDVTCCEFCKINKKYDDKIRRFRQQHYDYMVISDYNYGIGLMNDARTNRLNALICYWFDPCKYCRPLITRQQWDKGVHSFSCKTHPNTTNWLIIMQLFKKSISMTKLKVFMNYAAAEYMRGNIEQAKIYLSYIPRLSQKKIKQLRPQITHSSKNIWDEMLNRYYF